MSVGVKGRLYGWQMPLTVVCTSLPKNTALSFGCATNDGSCKVKMVAYESL